MKKLNELLRELGISKVKLAKFLGVSRQMIYNYLELDDVGKWPKDKKVMLLNLLGIKSAEEINSIKINTDYIMDVETRLSSLSKENTNVHLCNNSNLYSGLEKKQKELLANIIDILKEGLEDDKNVENYNTYRYLYHFLQTINTSRELQYILAYVSKVAGFTKVNEFVFDEKQQFVFESILFSAFSLYENKNYSENKIAKAHSDFARKIEAKNEEILSRTQELNSIKTLALKELNYTEINDDNLTEVLEKMAEIEYRKIAN